MKKLFYLLFLFSFLGFAQTTATITSTGTGTSVTQFNGGVSAVKILRTPVIDTSALFTNIPNLGRVLTYGNKLYHHNGTNYKRVAYFSDIAADISSLQDVIEVNPIATYPDEIRITSGAGTVFTELSLAPEVTALTHSSGVNFSQVALSNHFVGLSAGDNQLSLNPDTASINSAFGVGAPVNPGDAVRLSDLEAATTGIDLQGVTDNGATTTNSLTTGGYFTNDGTDTRLIADEVGALRTNVSMQFTNSGAEIGRHTLTSPGSDTILYTWQLPSSDGTIALLSDITGGTQTLDQTLTNDNTTSQSIIFTDTGSPAGLNGSTAGYLKFTGGNVLIGSNSTSSKNTTFKDHGIEIGSAMTDGIKGLADYSANYTANSFVQYDWVLSQIPATSSFLVKANNLSDLPSASTARTNLGLTALATTTPGTGVATFLTTPTSANLAAALTDETGTGAAVFGTSPTFTTSITTPVVAPAATSGSTVGTSSIPYENVYTQNVYRPTGAMMIGTQASNSLGFATNSVSRWSIASGGVLAPVLNNTYTFGTSSLRPSIGYFVAGDFSSTIVAAPATLSTELATLGQLTSYMHTLNTTTTALSSATLNSTYPNVTIFHTVHCPLIATGGINYIKRTEAGSSDVWDMVVTAVAP